MIIYSPLDGHPFPHSIESQARRVFLMTRLGKPIPKGITDIRKAVEKCCKNYGYSVIDAQAKVTGRDILLKIWKLIAATPISVGVLHEDMPEATKANIFYEIGVAQALGKETVIVKSPEVEIPSDFVRSEYVNFDENFQEYFTAFLDAAIEQANYYETVADQLDRNPILALDYFKRAYLIKGDKVLKKKAAEVVEGAGLEERAANSIELLAAAF